VKTILTLDRIYQAAHSLNGVIRETEIVPGHNLIAGENLYLKTENLQVTGSFKIRGSYFKISTLNDLDKSKGVIACSAGNHAQGVALAAARNGISSTIFLPSTAPISKVEATRSYGANIQLIDGVYDDAYQAAVEYQKETGGIFIHPFDDEDVIAGQGTIALEILREMPDIGAIIVPIGGGGLISGIGYAIKSLKPECKIYGVQAAGAASMCNSINEHTRCSLFQVETFADGIAVKMPGELTYEMCDQYVDDIVTVSDDEIATAILTLMEQQKLVAEGAGAVSIAAAMFNKLPLEGKKVCAILSGGNIDVNILSRVIHRGLLTSGRLTDLTIELLDKPGQLKLVSAIIADLGANVTKVYHDPGGENTAINGCFLRVTMETKNHDHLKQIKEALTSVGLTLSENVCGPGD
jgi:threonine dehydratase